MSNVGRNPRSQSFTFGEDPTGKHKERVEEHEGNHGDEREKHSTDKESITQGLDHRKHKVSRDPKSTKEDTRVTFLLREEVLIVFSWWRP